MKKRVHEQKLPEVTIVNLAEEKKSRPDLFFSDKLISALWDNMDKRQQSLLFVNRRGFASFMLCRDCGHIVQCRHCRVSLTMHRHKQRLVCHYCGYSVRTDIICPDCGSSRMEGLGLGSERIEAEVQQLIPHARVARLDSDTAANRKQYINILKSVSRQDVDILIGNEEDPITVFGIKPKGTDVDKGKLDTEDYRNMSKALMERFGFKKVAITLRESVSASENFWSACLFNGREFIKGPRYHVRIVDRVGTGDAFAAGLIYSLLKGRNDTEALSFGVAAACLKHSIWGDFNIASVEEVERLAAGGTTGRVQR